jgi:uncharacterized repeat protein (TIGR01451 family)
MKRVTKITAMVLMLTVGLSADITGTVFRDLPMNGSALGVYGVYHSATEPGVAGVTVVGVDEGGKRVTKATDIHGRYTLTGLSGKVRVEFGNYPSYLKESFNAAAPNSSIRFVHEGDSGVDFGLHNPDDYSADDDPILISSIAVNGATNAQAPQQDLVAWQYKNKKAHAFNIVVNKNQLGSIWGIAYDKNHRVLYTSALLRRHVGLPDGDDDGYGDIGVIYKLSDIKNPNTSAPEIFYRFSNSEVGTIGDDDARGLSKDSKYPSSDPDAFAKAGNVGIGDIDLSADGKELYVTNLYNKKLYTINTQTRELISSVDIPKECSDPQDARGFALKYSDGELYVGVTCVALNTQNRDDLKATIYRYKRDTQDFGKVLEFPLTYKKGFAYFRNKSVGGFNPWVTQWEQLTKADTVVIKPQPLLSDIEFVYRKGKKYMTVSILDRLGLQTGYENHDTQGKHAYQGVAGGDLLIASLNSDGSATLESGGKIDGQGGSSNKQGPGGGEFFHGDNYSGYHQEVVMGGIAYLPGSNTMPANAFDSANKETYASGGTRFFDLENGSYHSGKRLYTYIKKNPTFPGKSGGIGDLELLTDPSPIEIGDRVWLDSNQNGIQDPDEKGIANVHVQLVCRNQTKATAITNSNGYYIFSNDTNKNSTSSHRYNISDLQPKNTNNCLIKITKNQKALQHRYLTSKESTNNDRIDSDARDDRDDAILGIQPDDIPANGANNHSLDAGFTQTPPAPKTYCIGDYVWIDSNKNGIQDRGETGAGSVKVTLNETREATATNADGTYQFCGLANGKYSITVEKNSLPYGYILTDKNKGTSDARDSDVDPSTGTSDAATIKDANTSTLDVGIYQLGGSLAGNVSEDTTGDNNGDTPIKNVEIKLYKDINHDGKPDGNPIAAARTNNNGNYKFENLVPGYYVAVETQPNGYLEVKENEGGADNDMPDNHITNAIAAKVDAGEEDKKNDFVEKKAKSAIDVEKHTNGADADRGTGSIVEVGSKITWLYIVVNTGNICLHDVKIVDDKEGVISCPKTTLAPDEKMTCLKTGTAKAGQYSNMATATAKDPHGTLVKDKDPSHYYGGDASIGDYVWLDVNKNGIQDPNEHGIKGIVVHLYKDGTDTGKTAHTNADGKYLFGNLIPGAYHVKFDKPAEYTFSPKDQGSNDAKDSDADRATGLTAETQLKAGEHDTSHDAGMYKPVACKYADISLTKEVNQSVAYEGDRVRFTVVVHNDGPVNATGVIATDKVPSGYAHVGNGSAGVTVNGNTVTMNAGTLAVHASKTFTFEATVKESGEHLNWAEVTAMDQKDTDSNVSQDHTVDDNGDGNPVDDDEDSAKVIIGVKASIGDTVWNDSNHNGIQDNNESGMEGIVVHLYKDGSDTGKTDITDTSGTYGFADLAPGRYSIMVDKPADTDEDQYRFTKQDQGDDDAQDSDVNANNGQTETTELVAGENDTSWDAGIFKRARQAEHGGQVKIGDFVWIEDDDDGNPATGLITYPPAGTIVKAVKSNGEILTAKTEANGHYEMWVGDNSTYTVTVEGLSYLTPTAGSNDSAISDTTTENNHSHNPNGTTVTVGTVDNMTVDFGFKLANFAHIGDYFWVDSNGNGIQDAGEDPVVGATVQLLDENGNVAADMHGNESQTTDDTGKYGFDVVPGKTYKVRFVMPKYWEDDGYVFTEPNTGSDDAKDSDVDSTGQTATVTPVRGDIISTLDAGIKCPCVDIESDSIDALNKPAVWMLILLMLTLGAILIRREEGFILL